MYDLAEDVCQDLLVSEADVLRLYPADVVAIAAASIPTQIGTEVITDEWPR